MTSARISLPTPLSPVIKTRLSEGAIRAVSLVLSLYIFRDYWARQFLLLAVKPD